MPNEGGRNTLLGGIERLLATIDSKPFSGDPSKDWIVVREILERSGSSVLQTVAREAERLPVLGLGELISGSLTNAWQNTGHYQGARSLFDSTIAREQIAASGRMGPGISVMTLHKAKGKEFDGVIIFDEPYSSALVDRRERSPYPASRKLLRVGVTRARYCVLYLHSASEEPELLKGHKL